MTHVEILRRIKVNLDELKLRNPRLYAAEERDLMRQEHRLTYEVAQTPLPTEQERKYWRGVHIRRAERSR